jgi:hypothetical protein
MTIPITTRSGKGSPLTPAEMDTNLINLARDATQAVQGNVRIATDAETTPFAANNLAISPSSFPAAFTQGFANYASSGGVNNAFPGYFRFPNGPLVQYGFYDFVGGGPLQQTFALNVAYPSANYALSAIALEVAGDEGSYFVCKGKTNTTFTLKVYGGNSFISVLWIAIGPY